MKSIFKTRNIILLFVILVFFIKIFLFSQNGFTQVIKKSGISHDATYGGVSWGDYNSDGYTDLLIRTNTAAYKLFRNNKNETFTDVTKESGLISTTHATTATFGDFNNDGCSDIHIGNGFDSEKGTSAILYKNNCDGTFSDVSIESGITKEKYHTRGVAWGDYNSDGFIDLYVSTWGTMHFLQTESAWTMTGWDFEPNILYRNNKDGTFTNITKEAGVEGEALCSGYENFKNESREKLNSISYVKENPYPKLKTNWQAVWFDYNNDNNPDLYVSHEVTTNVLYKNNGDGTFKDVTEEAGFCRLHSTHGVAIGDYDGNGYLDLYTSGSLRNLYYKNNGDGTFTEVSEDNGTHNFGFLGWGVGTFDYDNDGDLDIYTVNGSTQNTSSKGWYPSRLDSLLENNGAGEFISVSAGSGIFGNDFKTFGAFADFNNDGFTDIFVTTDPDPKSEDSPKLPNRLYKNKPNGNNWLTIKLIGTESNRDGIGAKIKIESAGKKQLREVISGGSLLSQNSIWPSFGLGDSETIDSLVVLWPSGNIQTLKNIKVNQIITVTEE